MTAAVVAHVAICDMGQWRQTAPDKAGAEVHTDGAAAAWHDTVWVHMF